MEPGEALGIAAQIAVALAGFAGVVVVFRREAVHEWSGIDKLRLRLLLANSILPVGSFHAGIAFAHRRTHATRNLEMVQRHHTGRHSVARYGNFKNVPAFKSPKCAATARYPIHFLRVRSLRRGSHALASIQHCVTRRVLAIFRRNRIPTRYGNGSICADDPSAAGIKPHTVCVADSTPQLRCHEGDRNPP